MTEEFYSEKELRDYFGKEIDRARELTRYSASLRAHLHIYQPSWTMVTQKILRQKTRDLLSECRSLEKELEALISKDHNLDFTYLNSAKDSISRKTADLEELVMSIELSIRN